jgi:hypothetical protein
VQTDRSTIESSFFIGEDKPGIRPGITYATQFEYKFVPENIFIYRFANISVFRYLKMAYLLTDLSSEILINPII